MATPHIKKKSTLCLNCGKSVSHNADSPPQNLCYDCRKELDNDGYELQLWYQLVNFMEEHNDKKQNK